MSIQCPTMFMSQRPHVTSSPGQLFFDSSSSDVDATDEALLLVCDEVEFCDDDHDDDNSSLASSIRRDDDSFIPTDYSLAQSIHCDAPTIQHDHDDHLDVQWRNHTNNKRKADEMINSSSSSAISYDSSVKCSTPFASFLIESCSTYASSSETLPDMNDCQSDSTLPNESVPSSLFSQFSSSSQSDDNRSHNANPSKRCRRNSSSIKHSHHQTPEDSEDNNDVDELIQAKEVIVNAGCNDAHCESADDCASSFAEEEAGGTINANRKAIDVKQQGSRGVRSPPLFYLTPSIISIDEDGIYDSELEDRIVNSDNEEGNEQQRRMGTSLLASSHLSWRSCEEKEDDASDDDHVDSSASSCSEGDRPIRQNSIIADNEREISPTFCSDVVTVASRTDRDGNDSLMVNLEAKARAQEALKKDYDSDVNYLFECWLVTLSNDVLTQQLRALRADNEHFQAQLEILQQKFEEDTEERNNEKVPLPSSSDTLDHSEPLSCLPSNESSATIVVQQQSPIVLSSSIDSTSDSILDVEPSSTNNVETSKQSNETNESSAITDSSCVRPTVEAPVAVLQLPRWPDQQDIFDHSQQMTISSSSNASSCSSSIHSSNTSISTSLLSTNRGVSPGIPIDIDDDDDDDIQHASLKGSTNTLVDFSNSYNNNNQINSNNQLLVSLSTTDGISRSQETSATVQHNTSTPPESVLTQATDYEQWKGIATSTPASNEVQANAAKRPVAKRTLTFSHFAPLQGAPRADGFDLRTAYSLPSNPPYVCSIEDSPYQDGQKLHNWAPQGSSTPRQGPGRRTPPEESLDCSLMNSNRLNKTSLDGTRGLPTELWNGHDASLSSSSKPSFDLYGTTTSGQSSLDLSSSTEHWSTSSNTSLCESNNYNGRIDNSSWYNGQSLERQENGNHDMSMNDQMGMVDDQSGYYNNTYYDQSHNPSSMNQYYQQDSYCDPYGVPSSYDSSYYNQWNGRMSGQPRIGPSRFRKSRSSFWRSSQPSAFPPQQPGIPTSTHGVLLSGSYGATGYNHPTPSYNDKSHLPGYAELPIALAAAPSQVNRQSRRTSTSSRHTQQGSRSDDGRGKSHEASHQQQQQPPNQTTRVSSYSNNDASGKINDSNIVASSSLPQPNSINNLPSWNPSNNFQLERQPSSSSCNSAINSILHNNNTPQQESGLPFSRSTSIESVSDIGFETPGIVSASWAISELTPSVKSSPSLEHSTSESDVQLFNSFLGLDDFSNDFTSQMFPGLDINVDPLSGSDPSNDPNSSLHSSSTESSSSQPSSFQGVVESRSDKKHHHKSRRHQSKDGHRNHRTSKSDHYGKHQSTEDRNHHEYSHGTSASQSNNLDTNGMIDCDNTSFYRSDRHSSHQQYSHPSLSHQQSDYAFQQHHNTTTSSIWEAAAESYLRAQDTPTPNTVNNNQSNWIMSTGNGH